jgi:hypothetical protein
MEGAAQEPAAAGFAGFVVGVVVVPDPGGEGTFADAGAPEARAQQHAATMRTGRRIIPPVVSSVRRRAFRLSLVERLIDPQPDDDERRAILAAMEAAETEEPSLDPYRSRWREAGLEESLDASDGG